MAKKKQDLTPEERLAAALVPEEKWPYALPEGWKWVYLSGILDVSKEKTEEFPPDTKYVGLENIEKDTGRMQAVDAEGIRSTKNIFEAGNILYGKLRPYLNKHSIAEFDGVCSTDILVFQTAPSVEKELLNRYFDLPQFISFAVSHSKGINLPRVSATEILTARMPLPPLSEQHRLVARIESLFAKLDAAGENVQSVLDSHETRKAALLHEAFTGKLIGTDEREMKPLSEIVELVRIGPFGSALHKEDYIHGGIPVINPKHIANQAINPDKHISISTSKADSMDVYKMRTNDIIIGRRGEMGRTAPVSEKESGWLCGTGCMLLRLKKEYDARFYSQILASQQGKQYLEAHAVGSTMKNLNEKIIKSLPVPIFSPPEQQEIVRILDRLLAREQRARQAAEETLAAIDRMKQSILARAFRGEL